MKTVTFQFPHFSHRIFARLVFSLEITLLWAGLAALIAVNIHALQKSRPAHWDRLMMLFESPLSVPRSIDLASLLWNQGHKEEARNVLGASTDPLQTLARWEEEAAALEKKYAFWQSVASTHPDYRDAFITLASLAYQLGSQDDARGWLAKAQALDPNSLLIQELATFFPP